jgi:hypothetical protein
MCGHLFRNCYFRSAFMEHSACRQSQCGSTGEPSSRLGRHDLQTHVSCVGGLKMSSHYRSIHAFPKVDRDSETNKRYNYKTDRPTLF